MRKSALVLLGLAAMATAPAIFAQAGVSVTMGQPGFYGTINIGSAPPPVTIYQQPVLVQPSPVPVAPVYLHVPPEHYKHWNRYCAQYGACGRPVYFVSDEWYNKTYVPHYQNHRAEYEHGDRHEYDDHGHEHDDHGRDHHESGERYEH